MKERKKKIAAFRDELLIHAEEELKKQGMTKEAFPKEIDSAKSYFVLGMLYMQRIHNLQIP